MSFYELLSIIVAAISMIVAIISICLSSKAKNKANELQDDYNSLVKRNNLFTAGQSELQLNQTIAETKLYVENIALQIAKLPPNAEEDMKALLRSSLKSAMEGNINAYESACGIYLDNKIDKERFKKLYNGEIKRIVESETHKEFYIPESTSKYQATWKVYREWNILE